MRVSFLILLSLTVTASGESCLVPSNTRGRSVPFRGDVCPSLPSGTMAIITSYKFECYGRIRAWHTFVRPQSVEEPNLAHTISFQVWRQAPLANTEGCYELVGENVFRDVVADKDGRVSMVACPCSAISVRPGDVVGYYTKVNSSCDITSTEIKLDVSYTMENVWYHTNTKKDPLLNSGNLACPFPVGPEPAKSLRSHLRAAPMLSIEMDEISSVIPTSTDASAVSSTPDISPTATTSEIYSSDIPGFSSAVPDIPVPTPSYDDRVTPSPPQARGSAHMGGLIATGVLLFSLFATVLIASIFIIRRRRRAQRNIQYKDLTTFSQNFDSMEGSTHSTTAETTVVPRVDYAVVDQMLNSDRQYGGSMTISKLETDTSVTIEIKKKSSKGSKM